MTTPDETRSSLTQAARTLRGQSYETGLEVANDVLSRVLAHPRRSLPVRARPPHEGVHVSEQVLVSRVRERVHATVPAVAVEAVVCRVEPDQTLTDVTVAIVARFGTSLLDAARQARAVAIAALDELLGPAHDDVTVTITHVHVDDVTVGDPRRTHPDDESAER